MVGYGNVGSSTVPFNMVAVQFPCVGTYITKQHPIFSSLLTMTCTYTHVHTSHTNTHIYTYTETHSHRLKKLKKHWIQLYFSRLLSTFLVASVKLYETHWAYEILHIHFKSQTLKTKAHFPALSMGSTWTAPKASSHRTSHSHLKEISVILQ